MAGRIRRRPPRGGGARRGRGPRGPPGPTATPTLTSQRHCRPRSCRRRVTAAARSTLQDPHRPIILHEPTDALLFLGEQRAGLLQLRGDLAVHAVRAELDLDVGRTGSAEGRRADHARGAPARRGPPSPEFDGAEVMLQIHAEPAGDQFDDEKVVVRRARQVEHETRPRHKSR